MKKQKKTEPKIESPVVDKPTEEPQPKFQIGDLVYSMSNIFSPLQQFKVVRYYKYPHLTRLAGVKFSFHYELFKFEEGESGRLVNFTEDELTADPFHPRILVRRIRELEKKVDELFAKLAEKREGWWR